MCSVGSVGPGQANSSFCFGLPYHYLLCELKGVDLNVFGLVSHINSNVLICAVQEYSLNW